MTWKRTGVVAEAPRTLTKKVYVPEERHLPPHMTSCISREERPIEKIR